MENRKQLSAELHNYITARKNMEPPEERESLMETQDSTSTEDESADEREKKSADKQPQLQQAEENLKGCQDCELAANRSVVVYGQGDVGARIMVVGEAPGAKEDEQGLPFVGPSGKLLRGGFEKVGLSEEDIYITNVVKCRPPNNRDPKKEELQSCRSNLELQLELIEPDVILTVGNFGLRYFLGEDKNITSARSEVYDWKGRALVPTYHPGYILRNRSQADSFVRDLKLAAKQLE